MNGLELKKRGKQNRKDIYFGPFANVNMVEEVIQQLERAFLLRSCSDNIFNSRKDLVFYTK